MGCSVQRGNEVCLFLPNRWPVSSRDSLHSALHLLCPATVVPSFLITGIYCSSGCLPVQISQQKACGDTEISGSGSQANFVRFLVIVTGTFFFFNRTFSSLQILPDSWQSGSCFLFTRCTFSCCLFSINFQMLLHILFIFSTVYPFLNFCIIPFHSTFPSNSSSPFRRIPESCCSYTKI